MSIGPIAFPSGPQDAADLSRLSAVAAPSAVRTELPTRDVVAQPPSTAAPDRQDARARQEIAAKERRVTVDAETRLVLSQVFDPENGDLLSQVPDQALLRLKAYAREVVAEIDAKAAGRRVERIA